MCFYSRLGTHFEGNATLGGLGVVDRLSARLDVRADTMVVARSECVEVAEPVNGDRVFRRAVADGSGIAADLPLLDVVGRFCADEEAVATENGVRGEVRALRRC